MSSPSAIDPVGGARNINFTTDLIQCETSTLTWDGGVSPVRVEFYQQDNDTAMWETITDGMFNVVYNSSSNVTHSLDWVVNVKASRNVWAVIVDHAGSFSQHQEPYTVGAGLHSSCLYTTELKDSDPTTHTQPNKGLSPVSGGLIGALFAALFAVAGLTFWVASLRKRLARTQQKVKHLSVAPTPATALRSGLPGAGAGLAAVGGNTVSRAPSASSSRKFNQRSKSLDSARSMQQLNDPYAPSTSSSSADDRPRYDDLYDEMQGATWVSGTSHDPFSDRYATLGSDGFVGSSSYGADTYNDRQHGSNGEASTYNSSAAVHLLPLHFDRSSIGGPPHPRYASDDMQMVERQSIRSEPSVAGHSIATEATLASSSSQSDATTINSERDRLGADLSRTNSGTGASTTSSHDSAPQFFKISVNPAQFMRDSIKNRKVS